jgi:hypothetical protein
MTHFFLLLDLPQLRIDQNENTQQLMTLLVHVETPEASCPLCGCGSSRVHSRYRRPLQDLPCAGKTLRFKIAAILLDRLQYGTPVTSVTQESLRNDAFLANC